MAEKQVACDCGTVIREKSDAQLIAAVQQHAEQIHGLTLTPDQILAMAEVP